MALIGHWRAWNGTGTSSDTVIPDLSAEGVPMLFLGAGGDVAVTPVGGQCAVHMPCGHAGHATAPDPALYAPETLTIVARLAFMGGNLGGPIFSCQEPGVGIGGAYGAFPGICAYSDGGYPIVLPSIKWVFLYNSVLNALALLMNDGTIDVPSFGAGLTVYSDALPAPPPFGQMVSVGVRFGPEGAPATFFWQGAAVGGDDTPFDLMIPPTGSATTGPPHLQIGSGGEIHSNAHVAIAALRLWNEARSDADIAAAMAEDALVPVCGEPFPAPPAPPAREALPRCVVIPVCPEDEEAGVVALSPTRTQMTWVAGRGPLRLRTRRR